MDPKLLLRGHDDPTKVELFDDKFNEADMQQMADTIIQVMIKRKRGQALSRQSSSSKKSESHEEHIDTVSLTDSTVSPSSSPRK